MESRAMKKPELPILLNTTALVSTQDTLVFNDAELSSAPLIGAVQNFGHSLGVAPSQWPDFQMTLYANARSKIVCPCGREAFLNTELFEANDNDIDAGLAHLTEEANRNWFRMRFGKPCAPDARVFLMPDSREKFRVTATILAAAFPKVAESWPRILPANDNCTCTAPANDNFED